MEPCLETLFREREPAPPAFLSLYDEHIQFQEPLQRVSGLYSNTAGVTEV